VTLVLVSFLGLLACTEPTPKSRLEKRIDIYLGRMESAAVDLEHKLDKIADMKRLNTPGRMNEAILVIKNGEKTLRRANESVSAYRAFVNQNSRELKQEGLDHYIDIRDL
jgi:Skp family chaperone for outer membrane proteins